MFAQTYTFKPVRYDVIYSIKFNLDFIFCRCLWKKIHKKDAGAAVDKMYFCYQDSLLFMTFLFYFCLLVLLSHNNTFDSTFLL